jgi:hypothetical protein
MMKEGLLWFDNDPHRKLSDKINRAVVRYQVKFGRRPTICYLNLTDFEGQPEEVDGIQLRTAPNVLPHHFWIGVENERSHARAA